MNQSDWNPKENAIFCLISIRYELVLLKLHLWPKRWGLCSLQNFFRFVFCFLFLNDNLSRFRDGFGEFRNIWAYGYGHYFEYNCLEVLLPSFRLQLCCILCNGQNGTKIAMCDFVELLHSGCVLDKSDLIPLSFIPVYIVGSSTCVSIFIFHFISFYFFPWGGRGVV